MKLLALVLVIAALLAIAAASPCVEDYASVTPRQRYNVLQQVKEQCEGFALGTTCRSTCEDYFYAKFLPSCDGNGQPQEPCGFLCEAFTGACNLSEAPCTLETSESCSEGPRMTHIRENAEKNTEATSISASFSIQIPSCSISFGARSYSGPCNGFCYNWGRNQIHEVSPIVYRILKFNEGSKFSSSKSFIHCWNQLGETRCRSVNQTSEFACLRPTAAGMIPFQCSSHVSPFCYLRTKWDASCRTRNCCANLNREVYNGLEKYGVFSTSPVAYMMHLESRFGDPVTCNSFSGGDHCYGQLFQAVSSDTQRCRLMRDRWAFANRPSPRGKRSSEGSADELTFSLF